MSIRVDNKIYHLQRLHSKLCESITWEVLSEDKKSRLGILARQNSPWLSKKFGWKEFKVQYWLLHIFWHHRIIAGKSMREAIQVAFPINEQLEGRMVR